MAVYYMYALGYIRASVGEGSISYGTPILENKNTYALDLKNDAFRACSFS